MRRIDKIVIHCSDSDDSLDIGFREINEWHRQNGWLAPSGVSCGYHFVIRRDGRSEPGRLLSEAGAHARGHNSRSIGICWVGRRQPTSVQLSTLHALARGLMHQFSVPIENVVGHYELDGGKTCPNLDMDRFRANLIFKKI